NAATRAFGIDRGMPFPLADVAEADAVLLVGSNPADTMPPAMQFLDAGRARGARPIVIHPRAHAPAAIAFPRPGPSPRRPPHCDRPARDLDRAQRSATPAACPGNR